MISLMPNLEELVDEEESSNHLNNDSLQNERQQNVTIEQYLLSCALICTIG